MTQMGLYEYQAVSALWAGDDAAEIILQSLRNTPTSPTAPVSQACHRPPRIYAGWGKDQGAASPEERRRFLGTPDSGDFSINGSPQSNRASCEARTTLDGIWMSVVSPEKRAQHRGRMAAMWQAHATAQRQCAQLPCL
eukprot:m.20136 g.20136  ORF g.20136 m.20136 type:complete len:138 (+) comp5532_c0_seq1:197-610(+)